MDFTYDIFRLLPDSTPLWMEAVVGLEQARKRLNALSGASPAAYLIYDSHLARFVDQPKTALAFKDKEAVLMTPRNTRGFASL
jgi:hypothetical protein